MDDYMKQEQLTASTSLPAQDTDEAFDPDVALGRPKRRPALLFGGIILLVALLGSASYMAARMLAPRNEPAEGKGNMMLTTKGGGGAVSKSINIVPAKELPSETATAVGVFQRREDNSIFMGTGKVSMMVKADASGAREAKASSDGPTVEVVVTHDTQIWADVTPLAFDKGAMPEGDVQQKVKPGSLDDLNQNTIVQVWGERNGDRIIATTLAYQAPG